MAQKFSDGAKTASFNSNNVSTVPFKGAVLVVDVTAVSGTSPSQVIEFQRYDNVSGKYVTILTSAAITAVGTYPFEIFPGVAVVANRSANNILGDEFRAKSTISGTSPSFTQTMSFEGVR